MGLCLIFLSNVNLYVAREAIPEYDTTSEIISDTTIATYLNEDGTVNRKKLNLLVQAFLSADDEIAKEELKQLYVWGFWQSSSIPIGEEISIWNVFSLLLALFLLAFVGQLFLIIGNVFTFISMVLVKLTSGGVIASVATMIQEFILDTILFKQGTSTPLGIRIIILIALISLLTYLVSQRHTQVTDFLKTFVMTIFCAIIVGTLSVNTILVHEMINERVIAVTDAVFDIDNTAEKEIEEKSMVFSLLQIQPFLMRNFGVASTAEINTACNETETNQEQFEKLLLNGDVPEGKQKTYAEYQATTCGNNFIKHSDRPLVEIEIFLISLIGGVTTIVLSIPIDIIYLFRLIIVFVVCFRPTVAVFGMGKKLFKLDWRGLAMVFLTSLFWMILGEAAVIIVTTIMQILIKTITTLSAIHPILNLLFGAVLFVIAVFALKNIKTVQGAVSGALKHALTFAKDGFSPDANPLESMKENIFQPLAETGGTFASAVTQKISPVFDKPIQTRETKDAFDDELENDFDLENEVYSVSEADEFAETQEVVSSPVEKNLSSEGTENKIIDDNTDVEMSTTVANEHEETAISEKNDFVKPQEFPLDESNEDFESEITSVETDVEDTVLENHPEQIPNENESIAAENEMPNSNVSNPTEVNEEISEEYASEVVDDMELPTDEFETLANEMEGLE